jgi:hypothetical protein
MPVCSCVRTPGPGQSALRREGEGERGEGMRRGEEAGAPSTTQHLKLTRPPPLPVVVAPDAAALALEGQWRARSSRGQERVCIVACHCRSSDGRLGCKAAVDSGGSGDSTRAVQARLLRRRRPVWPTFVTAQAGERGGDGSSSQRQGRSNRETARKALTSKRSSCQTVPQRCAESASSA